MTDELVKRLRGPLTIEYAVPLPVRDELQRAVNERGEAADVIEALLGEQARLGAALGEIIGNMMNAQFDLEGGATKAFAIKQIRKAIASAIATLTACSDRSLPVSDSSQ
jgi:hypothetical protein